MARSKTTPAIKRAQRAVNEALDGLRTCDVNALETSVRENQLVGEQQRLLNNMLRALQQLAEAEALREKGSQQQDMFAGMQDDNFRAWRRPMNQPAPL